MQRNTRKPLTRQIKLTNATNTRSINVDCVVDTGSSTSLLSFDIVNSFDIEPIKRELQLQGAFGGPVCNPIGKICLYVTIDKVRRPITFVVVDHMETKCIIGWPDIDRLQLKLSHKGIFTNENRIFGGLIPEKVYLINVEASKSGTLKDNKKDEAQRKKPYLAVDLGQGEQLKREDLISLPTHQKVSRKESILKKLDSAFASNKFNIDKELNMDTVERIKAILYKNYQCISLSKNEIGNVPTWVEEFYQEFTVPEPVPCRLFPVNPVKAKFLCNELKKLVDMNVIEETKTQIVTSNLLAVPKKDGELRAVSDQRNSNLYTRPTNLRLPRIDQIARKLMGHKYYVALDIQKAYWSVSIPKEQRKWYTMQCPQCYKQYAWLKMAMGARNSATVFTHMLQIHVVGDLNDIVTCYIDDINFAFNDIEKGLQTLETLFERLTKFGLKIGLDKVQLFTRSLDAFGLNFDEHGMKPTNSRVTALENLKLPQNKKNLHSALASLNYFRSFIPNFSARAAKLYELTSEKVRYDQRIVNEEWPKIQNSLKNVIKVQRPDYSKPMILSTDASEFGIGMVLSQEIEGPNGTTRVILGCHSQGLSKSEKLWAIAQKELKAVYEGLVQFEQLLFNHLVILEIDNAAVYWVLKLKIGAIEINKRLPAVRYLLYISSFNYQVKHVSGKEPSFLFSDFLSRNNYELGPESKLVLGNMSKEPLLNLKAIVNGKYDLVPVNNIQQKDNVDQLLQIHRMDKSKTELHQLISLAQLDSAFCQKMKQKPTSKYKTIDNTLYFITGRGPFIVCPRFYTMELLKMVHESLHEGIRSTLGKINHLQIWIYKKYKNIAALVQNCKKCDPARSRACLKAENATVAKPHQPFDIVHIDLMNIGPTFVLVLVDSFSHFVIARVLRDGTSPAIKGALADIFAHFGLPHTICQDNGANLNSAVMKQFYADLGIYLSNSSVNNSRGNSLVEMNNRLIQTEMRILGSDNGHMNLNLYLIVHKINLRKQPGRRHSAFEVMFARKGSWVLQIPEIGQARKFAQDKTLKSFYETATEIRENMLKLMEKRRENIQKDIPMAKLNKHDHVRIKKFISDGNKKSFRPFSEAVWEILSVNPHTNTCVLRELTQEGFQPRTRRIHKRFLRKIQKRQSDGGDDFQPIPLQEPNQSEESKARVKDEKKVDRGLKLKERGDMKNSQRDDSCVKRQRKARKVKKKGQNNSTQIDKKQKESKPNLRKNSEERRAKTKKSRQENSKEHSYKQRNHGMSLRSRKGNVKYKY